MTINAKKEYVSPIDEAVEDITGLFRSYFNRGWISDWNIYQHERPGRTGMTYALMRKLLRIECQRRGVPFLLLSETNYGKRTAGTMRVKASRATAPLLTAMALMDQTKLDGIEGMAYGRMAFIRWDGQEITDAVLALLEQQKFIADIRAIGAEHYPVR